MSDAQGYWTRKLEQLGIELPPLVAPVANYVPAARSGSLVYTSGQLPMVDGALAAIGKLGAEVGEDEGRELARRCALNALAAVDDLDRLRAAYVEWPLFQAMIDNVAMSLAKTDERIAREYLALGDRDDLAALVLDELARTRDGVVAVSGGAGLLSNKPVLQRAVKLRSPYVDALSLLQLRALRALRETPEGTPVDPEQQRLLLLTVSGVAAGLQNTG